MLAVLRAALKELGVERLVLGVHDSAFPMTASEETGRGSPYSEGARQLLRFAAAQGFTGIQLGPQGMTHPGSPSPYEATLFTKNPLNLPLADCGLFTEAERASYRTTASSRVDYRSVHARFQRAQAALWQKYASHPELHGAVDAFLAANARWLIPDALYDALCRKHGRAFWLDWPDARDRLLFKENDEALLRAHQAAFSEEIKRHAFIQYLLRKAHDVFRAQAHANKLQLYADLQIGYSAHDAWSHSGLFLSGYRMGAPPSRTNPEGQPWGYFALDPTKIGTREKPGPVLEFVRQRICRILDDYDGVRVDHPHGWVDPWVYRSDDADPLHAVQTGARLRSTPADPNHPRLSSLSIIREAQLNPAAQPYADERVQRIEPAQVDAYSVLLDEIVEQSKARGIPPDGMVCEILSTLPNQIAACLTRHGLGRFRVTQKAKLESKTDVYRSENAQPQDWIMLGNHDTPPIWQVVNRWKTEDLLKARAADLASRLSPSDAAQLAHKLEQDTGLFVNAQLADAFISPARNVYIFFTDLFGYTDVYNTPGTVSDDNWSLRLPADFEALHTRRARNLEALSLPTALQMALRAKPTPERLKLADALQGWASTFSSFKSSGVTES